MTYDFALRIEMHYTNLVRVLNVIRPSQQEFKKKKLNVGYFYLIFKTAKKDIPN